MKTKILYIEDEPFLGKIVEETLEHRGFEVLRKKDGAQVMDSFKTFTPDICVLDVMLPHIDGFTIGQEIRSLYHKLPIIFLTAKSQTEDLLKGFESGGTDYIKKPFSMEELIVRINNQINLQQVSINNQSIINEEYNIGKFLFIPHKYELHTSDSVIKLTHKEAQVLNLLAINQNQIIDRKNLLLKVWGDDTFFNSRTLDVYIRKIRSYLSEDKGIELITLKGKGYHFLVP
ncbi:MAG TPA: response regulator transcription factor [Saprospiraceae bacterium]|nr:response regulator transcription factor [Saprospiraceae bacterium]